MTIPSAHDLEHLATVAGIIAFDHYTNETAEVSYKEAKQVVTSVDTQVHDLVTTYMRQQYPAIPVVGEEGSQGMRTGADDEHWLLVDELDGTGAFLHRIPTFSSMITLMRGAEPVIATISDPFGKHPYVAERGAGAYRKGKRLCMDSAPSDRKMVALCSWPKRPVNGMLIDNLFAGSGGGITGFLHEEGFRVILGGATGHFDALVAAGSFTGTIFPGGSLHDTAAGDLLVREAGGIATDLSGKPLRYGSATVFGHVFASQAAHSNLLSFISRRQ